MNFLLLTDKIKSLINSNNNKLIKKSDSINNLYKDTKSQDEKTYDLSNIENLLLNFNEDINNIITEYIKHNNNLNKNYQEKIKKTIVNEINISNDSFIKEKKNIAPLKDDITEIIKRHLITAGGNYDYMYMLIKFIQKY